MKAEPPPTRGVDRNSGTASNNGLIQFTTALGAFHKWFSRLGLLPHSSAFGLRSFNTRSNSFRAFQNRSRGSGDLLIITVYLCLRLLHISKKIQADAPDQPGVRLRRAYGGDRVTSRKRFQHGEPGIFFICGHSYDHRGVSLLNLAVSSTMNLVIPRVWVFRIETEHRRKLRRQRLDDQQAASLDRSSDSWPAVYAFWFC